MVVEVHEQFRPDVVKVLTERFEETHHLTRLFATPPEQASVPEVSGWDRDAAEVVLYDGHVAGDGWMTFVPK